MGKVVSYIHHKVEVKVDEQLKGKHRHFCLCYRCDLYHPDTTNNCTFARELYQLNELFHMTTPVWECPIFLEKKKETT